jgi:hypothetical protein
MLRWLIVMLLVAAPAWAQVSVELVVQEMGARAPAHRGGR